MNQTRHSRRSRAGSRPRPRVIGIWHRTGRWWRSVAAAPGVRTTGANPRRGALIRWAAGAIFLIFGAGKFADHAAELASFRHYALPAPEVFVYLVGALEVAGGVLLVVGLLTRLAALALAADMVGAIVISGLGRWELISLTLAPLLLVAMISVIRRGAGSWSLDGRLAPNLASGPGPHPSRARHHLVVRPKAPGGQRRP